MNALATKLIATTSAKAQDGARFCDIKSPNVKAVSMKRRDSADRIPNGAKIGDYKVVFMIGVGGFGHVYRVKNTKTHQMFAMKTESVREDSTLENEIQCLEDLDLECFPKVREHGVKGNVQYLVMNEYGQSVGAVFRARKDKVPRKAVIVVAAKMLDVIEKLHNLGFIHRDIKPTNFLVQNNPEEPLVLIDFGVAQMHIDPMSGVPIEPKKSESFIGTKKFASVFAHDQLPLGRRDDLISWVYSVVELMCGELKWANARTCEELVEMKQRMSPEEVCDGVGPELGEIYTYLMGLKWQEAPDYSLIRGKVEAMVKNERARVKGFPWDRLYAAQTEMSGKSPKKGEAQKGGGCNVA